MNGFKLKLFKALQSAFPNRKKLEMMLAQRFDVDYDTLTPMDTLDVEYWTVIEQIEAEGWLVAFARAAYETVPNNPLLASLMLDDGLTSAVGVVAPADRTTRRAGKELERIVRDHSLLADVPAFLARLQGLEAQVCRIETPGAAGPKALGTGFLVGPDLVMTNHHVVADFLPATPGVKLACRFDFLTDAAGVAVRPGILEPLAADWLVAAQAHDPSDLSLDENDVPAPDALDFAILRLARAFGTEPRSGSASPDNPPRGWVTLDKARVAQDGEDLFILQHPEGAPLKLGFGRVTKIVAGGLRLHHDVTTEPGSSGSPVFNGALELVALHHVGDPNSFRNALFNQAVPFAKILEFIDGKVEPFWETPP